MKKPGKHFIRKSVLGIASVIKDTVHSEEYACKKGLLQSLDPRTRVATILALLLLVLFARDPYVIGFLYALCVLLAVLSGIGPGFFLARTLLFVPLFSLFTAVPVLFSFISPGRVLFGFRLFGLPIAVTEEGLRGCLFFLARVSASVSFSVLLVMTVRHAQMLKTLRMFRIPKLFVMTLGMSYRYLFLFITMVENTYLAVRSRCGESVDAKSGRKVVAWNMAYLWTRSHHFHHEVYDAMVSRGFQGESHDLEAPRMRARDWAWASCVLVFTILTICVDRSIRQGA